MKKRILLALGIGLCLLAPLAAGCNNRVEKTSVLGDMVVEYDQEDLDSSWNPDESTRITLNGGQVDIDGDGASIAGNTLTISSQGTYVLTGSSDNLNIQVDAADSLVRIVLNGASIRAEENSVLQVIDSEKTIIILAEGTANTLADSADYTQEESDAALFSTADLTINGTGSLVIDSNYNDAIMTRDGLRIVEGDITINSVGDGIKGRDFIAVRSGSLIITADSDGLQATNDEAADKGFIAIEGGTLTLQVGGDGLAAETGVRISGGSLDIRTGNGSSDTTSQKGIKAGGTVLISGGNFTIDSRDDALHSNDSITIDGGSLNIASGDDGIHADADVSISGGTLAIAESYEGIEGANIYISGGTISLVSSDS